MTWLGTDSLKTKNGRLDTSNKLTGIAYNDLHLLMLHSFVRREAALNTLETVLCIFNRIFIGCEVVSTGAE